MTSLAERSGQQNCHSKMLSNSGILEDTPTSNDSINEGGEQRGRLKRRRSSHSLPRAPSPSRGHDRDSGSRHRHHHRKHHRPSSSTSPTPPPTVKKNRRRSDAEPDHTLRGRARNRSESRSRSPILEGAERELGNNKVLRKRSPPPSRHRSEEEDGSGGAVRRQRSYPNLYKEGNQQDGEAEKIEGLKGGERPDKSEKGGPVQEA